MAVQLVGKHVNSTVNNPIEAVSQWKAGALRPLCIFDGKRSVYTQKVTATMAWSDIPTCRELGVDTEYQMLRGIFMPPGVKHDQVDFYVDLFKKVMATDDWKRFMEEGAFNQTFMTGQPVQELGRGQRQAPLRPHEGGGLPRGRQIDGMRRASGARHRQSARRLASLERQAGPFATRLRQGRKALCRTRKAPADGRPLVSNRTMEIVVALILLVGCGIVIFDTPRVWVLAGARARDRRQAISRSGWR